MSKIVFKIVDEKGRITIPAPVRSALGITGGDVVTITAEQGSIQIRKAIVLENTGTMSMDAKQSYIEAVVLELDDQRLAEHLEYSSRQLAQRKNYHNCP